MTHTGSKAKAVKAGGFKHHTATVDLGRYSTKEALEQLSRADREAGGGGMSTSRNWLGLTGRGDVTSVPASVAEIVRLGDPTLAANVERARKEASSLHVAGAKSLKPAFQPNRVTGQRYDLGRVLQNAPGQWGRYERTNQREGQRIVTLYIHIGANGGTSAESLAWAPVSGIIVADLLEAAGYRVEIWGAFVGKQGAYQSTLRENGKTFHVTHQRVLIKAADVPLDMRAVSRACHPAISRAVLMPAMMATWKSIDRGGVVDNGYGGDGAVDPTVFGDEDGIAMRAAYDLLGCVAEVKRVVEDLVS